MDVQEMKWRNFTEYNYEQVLCKKTNNDKVNEDSQTEMIDGESMDSKRKIHITFSNN